MKKKLEEMYLGKTIVIVSMMGEDHYTGRTGVVKLVDDSNQLHGTWGGLAIQPENDKFVVVG